MPTDGPAPTFGDDGALRGLITDTNSGGRVAIGLAAGVTSPWPDSAATAAIRVGDISTRVAYGAPFDGIALLGAGGATVATALTGGDVQRVLPCGDELLAETSQQVVALSVPSLDVVWAAKIGAAEHVAATTAIGFVTRHDEGDVGGYAT